MPHRMLQQAIELMRQGKTDAGGRMLNVVIRDEDLSNTLRATAYAWLAETKDDLNFKIDCLNRAMDNDPSNRQIQERLSGLLAVQPSRPDQVVQRSPHNFDNAQTRPQPANLELPNSQPIDIVKPASQSMRPIKLPPPSERHRTTNEQAVYNPTSQNQTMPTVNPSPEPRTNELPRINERPSFGSTTNTYPVMPSSSPTEVPAVQTDPQYQMPPELQSQQRFRLNTSPRVVGIKQGPNGLGTGVFVTTDGIVATTRYIVGGSQKLSIELETGQELPAKVIRTYPNYDLAFLQTNAILDKVWPPTRMPVIADNETFIMIGFNSNPQRGNKRQSVHQLSSQWIQTDVEMGKVTNAGGHAIFDSQNYLVGLLTRNASRATGLAYGLHILHIYEHLTQYLRDRQQNPNAGYCHHCGNMTRAQQFGGYYCETCGGTLPGLEDTNKIYRSNPQLLRIYNENLNRPCPHCMAKTGFHNGKCLRCSHELMT